VLENCTGFPGAPAWQTGALAQSGKAGASPSSWHTMKGLRASQVGTFFFALLAVMENYRNGEGSISPCPTFFALNMAKCRSASPGTSLAGCAGVPHGDIAGQGADQPAILRDREISGWLARASTLAGAAGGFRILPLTSLGLALNFWLLSRHRRRDGRPPILARAGNLLGSWLGGPVARVIHRLSKPAFVALPAGDSGRRWGGPPSRDAGRVLLWGSCSGH